MPNVPRQTRDRIPVTESHKRRHTPRHSPVTLKPGLETAISACKLAHLTDYAELAAEIARTLLRIPRIH